MLLVLLQEETTGIEGVVKDAGDAAKDAAKDASREPLAIFRGLGEFLEGTYGYFISAEFVGDLLASLAVLFLGIVFYRLLTQGVPRILRWRRQEGFLDEEAVSRIKRQDTAITLTRNALRYVVFAIIALVVLSIFIENPLPGVAGATILAAVIGFGAQSFLRDVIAGFSIVFEGQYSVGDFVLIKPQDVSGVVEELGLRMTKIRSLSGEVSYIPNGTM
ncbi:MAG TPA: mechanosensitive ion channel domain-containing protein, partial [Rubrobacter sp.]